MIFRKPKIYSGLLLNQSFQNASVCIFYQKLPVVTCQHVDLEKRRNVCLLMLIIKFFPHNIRRLILKHNFLILFEMH